MQHADPRNHCADFSGWAGGPKGAQPGWWLFINGNGGWEGDGGSNATSVEMDCKL